MARKTLLIAQALISLMMATAMSGIMSLIAMGPTADWLAHWPRLVATAWPIAFVLTFVVSPLAFALAARLTGERRAHRAAE